MAKIKVKGQYDLIEIPSEVAQQIHDKRSRGQNDPKQWVSLGRWAGPEGDVQQIFLDPPESKEPPRDFFRESRERLKFLDKRELANKQEPMFNLLVYILKKTDEPFEKYLEMTYNYLVNHPERIWMDIDLWMEGWDIKNVRMNLFEERGMVHLYKVMGVEMEYEREHQLDMKSLAESYAG